MGWRHYLDLAHMMVDSSYTPEQYRRPLPRPPTIAPNATPQQEQAARDQYRATLREIGRQDNEYNNQFQRAAANTETAMMTTAEVGLIVLSPDHGLVSAPMVEAGVNSGLRQRGDGAPVRSVWQLAPVIGDEHYRNGGLPADHPSRRAYGPGNGNTGLGTPTEIWNGTVVAPATGLADLVQGNPMPLLGWAAGDPAGIAQMRPGQAGNPHGLQVDPVTSHLIVPPGFVGNPLDPNAPGVPGAAPVPTAAPTNRPPFTGGMGDMLGGLFNLNSLLGGGLGALIGFFIGGGPIGALIGGALGGLVGKPIIEGIMSLVSGPSAPQAVPLSAGPAPQPVVAPQRPAVAAPTSPVVPPTPVVASPIAVAPVR